MSAFSCPVCSEKLDISGKSYRCPNRHSFDIARSGYVNLLLAKHGGGTVHGDNKLMVRARRDFLEKGAYAPLRESLCRKVLEFAKNGDTILDAGCGEGYYTSGVKAALDSAGISAELYGIDISKTAAEFAAKRRDGVHYAAASVFHIPMMSGSCGVVTTLFAPFCREELLRVLRPGGALVMAIPSEDHLWELKTAVYDTPYRNEVKSYEVEGFDFHGAQRLTYTMELNSPEEIQSLFSMTPYYYKTGRKEQERLAALTQLKVTADFELLTYSKQITNSD